ncbi:MAG: hypothetical protein WD533_08645 [Dehalococcoidia bacterium]
MVTRHPYALIWLPVGLVAGLLLAACAGTEADAGTPGETSITPIVATPILATKELHVGTQRVAFLLETPTALVTAAEARVTSYAPGEGGAPRETTNAEFHEWPYATRGTYVTELRFDQPGEWRLLVEVDDAGFIGSTEINLKVAEESRVRTIGQLAPFSNSRTLASAGGDLASITSHYQPDPELYHLSIAEALITGRPSVIVFASPAFCTTPTCGPQVDTVSELKERYREAADFIHVEVYDNPDEIQGDLNLARLSPVLAEWGIDQVSGYVNESWVFVLGRDGRITARFEGYATLGELESALLEEL